MIIRSTTISYYKSKSKSIRNREQDIIQKLDLLDDAICKNMTKLKLSLSQFMKRRVNRLCFEQNVAGWKTENVYFVNLEKRKYNKKTISELRLQDKSTTNNANVILDQTETFYKYLYTAEATFSDEECDKFIRNLKHMTNAKQVLEILQNDKALGEDGFTVEFYKLM